VPTSECAPKPIPGPTRAPAPGPVPVPAPAPGPVPVPAPVPVAASATVADASPPGCCVTGPAWPGGTRDGASGQFEVLAEEMAAPGADESAGARGAVREGTRLLPQPAGRHRGRRRGLARAQPGRSRAGRSRAGRLPPALFPAGLLLGDCSGMGAGFADGGFLEVLPPGAVLAGFAAAAWDEGLGKPSDDELIGLLRAWRRLSSWAAAGELAAVAELAARRQRDRAGGSGPGSAACQPADCVPDELACALTLTRRSSQNLADRAAALTNLPATAAGAAPAGADRYAQGADGHRRGGWA
jgi:hypothetical protein